MASEPSKNPATTPVAGARHKGVKIFTYPKIIFILPSMIAAILCGIGMLIFSDNTLDPTVAPKAQQQAVRTQATADAKVNTDAGRPVQAKADQARADQANADGRKSVSPATGRQVRRFSSPQNVMGILFLLIFGINLIIMAIDFPRFTLIALILTAAAVGFFILWLNVYFDLVEPLTNFLEGIYTVANAGFYFTFAAILFITFAIIWATRYLDYWEILPNEILHNHGPMSDLERFPTFNLKFDKEIPDILEYALLRSGRLVLHVQNERKAIVLDNVLWIDRKEAELKKLMSRMDVRITTDAEAGEPT